MEIPETVIELNLFTFHRSFVVQAKDVEHVIFEYQHSKNTTEKQITNESVFI
jgi:hypothetical protein